MSQESNEKPTESVDSKAAASTPPAPKNVRSEPQLPLPTDRITFDKQLKLLRAYAAVSDNGKKAASNEDVGSVVEMKASTVSLANAFFVKNGFLARSGREYTPAKEVLDYKLAYDWDPATAASKLAPLLEKSWFVQAIRPKLDLRAVEENEAIGDLAQKAGAGPDYRNQIRTLIDYTVAAGIAQRDGGMLVLVRKRPGEAAAEPTEPQSQPAPAPRAAADDPGNSDLGALPFGQVGSIKFAVSINVDMSQMVQWDPVRITAFFTGLAQVIAAQKGGK